MKNTSISILGTIAVDTIETKSKKESNIGGSATFAAIAASFLSKPGIVSVIGNDFAIETLKILNKYNVDTSGIKKEPGPTFQWTARYDEVMGSRSSIFTDVGVFGHFKPVVPDIYRSSDCLVIGAVDPEIQLSFISQFECPKLIIGDTIDYYIENVPEKVLSLFESCNLVIINEKEARTISCETSADRAAKSILSLGPIIVILKQGKNGATLYYNSRKKTIPAFQIENCNDPTGAGDTFLGAFASYLANSLPVTESDIFDAIIYANCISSFTIQEFGLKGLASVEREEVNRRCKYISSKSNLPIPKLNPKFRLDTSVENCTSPAHKNKNFLFLPAHYPIPDGEISKDVDMVLWSMRLHRIRRYFHQRFFEAETREAEYASRIEPHPRLESVSEHSWHVADTALILAPRFSGLNVHHCLALAIIHDKLEIIIGDIAPIGRDGTGEKTHAFDKDYRKSKELKEVDASEYYLGKLSQEARLIQEGLLNELHSLNSKEARFVKAIDKFQALAYVYTKKNGKFEDKHVKFTLQYTKKCIYLFPPLWPHYKELKKRLLHSIAQKRKLPYKQVVQQFKTNQLELF